MSYKIIKHYLTKNDCYKKGVKRSKTTGILRHDTGAGNPYLKRYIDDSENLGKNQYGNHWNMSGISKCVHAMIGLDKNGDIAIYQTLPWDYRCWGCGSGSKGSYNDTHIQYEICDDGYKDKTYFEKCMKAADWLDAYLCKLYGLSSSNVTCHSEAHDKGYATNHGDITDWLTKNSKDMKWVRECVAKQLKSTATTSSSTKTSDTSTTSFKVKLKEDLNIRKGAGTSYDIKVKNGAKKGVTYTIVKTSGNWGLLKSYADAGDGWISISSKYVEKV